MSKQEKLRKKKKIIYCPYCNREIELEINENGEIIE